MARPIPSSQDQDPPRVLLVEGQDDEYVVSRLLERHESALSFSILNKQTISKLLPSISLEIRAPGRQVVGILVDANDNMTARWDAVTRLALCDTIFASFSWKVRAQPANFRAEEGLHFTAPGQDRRGWVRS